MKDLFAEDIFRFHIQLQHKIATRSAPQNLDSGSLPTVHVFSKQNSQFLESDYFVCTVGCKFKSSRIEKILIQFHKLEADPWEG